MKSKKITKTMKQEENIFDKLSDEWWKIDGSFSAHYMHLILLE